MGLANLNKGKTGEREMAIILRSELQNVCRNMGLNRDIEMRLIREIQRNQNQSAVGGSDINFFGLNFEVKRREQLQIEAWWKQVLKSVEGTDNIPILAYRQNHKKWKFMLFAVIPLGNGQGVNVRVNVEYEQFMIWFRLYVSHYLVKNVQ